MAETHILRATDRKGNVGFYNGRAGKDWISVSPFEAFHYTPQRAEDQATRFNRMSSVHGQRFVAVSKETIHVAATGKGASYTAQCVDEAGC